MCQRATLTRNAVEAENVNWDELNRELELMAEDELGTLSYEPEEIEEEEEDLGTIWTCLCLGRGCYNCR